MAAKRLAADSLMPMHKRMQAMCLDSQVARAQFSNDGSANEAADIAAKIDKAACALPEADAAGAAATLKAVGEPTEDTGVYTIKELASFFGVTARAIRFYEDQALITPQRKGQNRIYSKRDKARLAWILRGKRTGFSLAEIREMIDLYDLNDGRVTQRQVALSKCRARLAALAAQKQDIEHLMQELESFCQTLETLVHTPSSKNAL
jgi:DNA-binding transcriptional MerR regulator